MNKHFCFYCMSPVNEDSSCPVCGLTAGAYQPAPHHIPPGAILLNRYLFGRVLGEGIFTITYIAWDQHDNRRVVVKEFFSSLCAQRNSSGHCYVSPIPNHEDTFLECRSQFISQAENVAKLRAMTGYGAFFDAIVNLYSVFQANNTAYLVMEYLDGITLQQLVADRGPIPPEEFIPKLYPLMMSIGRMHREKVFHLCIRPDTILLTTDGVLKLIEFDFTNSMFLKAGIPFVGVPGFTPLELYGKKYRPRSKTDVYGLSATIYFCLTGSVPQNAVDRFVEDTLQSPVALGVALSPEQDEALMKGLSVEPLQRHLFMEWFAKELCKGYVYFSG